MKIIVLYQYYQAENAPGHSLIYDWTQYLASQGHDVTVIAGEAGYMGGERSCLPWFKRIFRKEKIGLVKVIRTYSYSARHRSYKGRLLSFVSFSLSSMSALFFVTKPHVVIASSPPIFPVFSAGLVCKLRSVPFIMEVRDLWPASAVEMGILKNKMLIAIMAWMEKTLYNQANMIIALTEGIKNDLYTRGWSEEKIALIRCAVDLNKLYPDPVSVSRLRNRYELESKKIILYFGALGEANNIPVILRAAKNLEAREDLFFMLVGDGMKVPQIKHDIEKMKLKNVLVHPAVPKDQARHYINAADLCIVTLLDIPLFKGALPTKLLDYMACGKPVLCGIRGEAEKIVQESQAGLTFSPNDEVELANSMTTLLDNPVVAKTMGEKGAAFVRDHFSATTMHKKIEAVVLSSANKF